MKRYSDHPGAHISMGQDPELQIVLNDLVSRFNLTTAVETGTFQGTGSTTVLARAFCPPGKVRGRVITIEASWANYRAALANLSAFPQVECRWGLSVRRDEAVQFIKQDAILGNHEVEADVFIDETNDPRAFYLSEIEGRIPGAELDSGSRPPGPPPEDLLRQSLREAPGDGTLILLDSAGGIGLLEFEITLEVMAARPFLLVLDDTGHLKHYRSVRRIRDDSRFRVLASQEKRGWLVARFSPR